MAREPPAAEDDAGTLVRDLLRSERTIILARWVATPWAFVQVLLYSTMRYPAGVERAALVLAALLPAGNLAAWILCRSVRTPTSARLLSMASMGFDVAVASGFVWLYAFDQVSSLWAILYILPLEGAARFGLVGSTSAWVATTALYVGREVWGSGRYSYRLQWDSISFRMGIGLLIALVAGLMARNLTTERTRLSAALARLRRVDEARSALVSALAHDVPNPLAVIRASLSTLRSRAGRLTPEETGELVRMAERQGERLERLAGGLLELARLEQGGLQLVHADLQLRDVVQRALSFADSERRVEVRVEPTVVVRADPERLEQIVVNLVSNALRHGGPPYLVEGRRDGDRVRLVVVDHGPGLPPADAAHVFEPFGLRSGPGSVGLGLAIVRGLVRAQGGEIRYSPNEPQGARFEVDLPAGSPPAEPPAASADGPTRPSAKVLE